MLPQHADEMTFSSTHLKYVNHGNDAEYAIKARERLGYKPLSPHSKSDPFENVKTNKDQNNLKTKILTRKGGSLHEFEMGRIHNYR